MSSGFQNLTGWARSMMSFLGFGQRHKVELPHMRSEDDDRKSRHDLANEQGALDYDMELARQRLAELKADIYADPGTQTNDRNTDSGGGPGHDGHAVS